MVSVMTMQPNGRAGLFREKPKEKEWMVESSLGQAIWLRLCALKDRRLSLYALGTMSGMAFEKEARAEFRERDSSLICA